MSTVTKASQTADSVLVSGVVLVFSLLISAIAGADGSRLDGSR